MVCELYFGAYCIIVMRIIIGGYTTGYSGGKMCVGAGGNWLKLGIEPGPLVLAACVYLYELGHIIAGTA